MRMLYDNVINFRVTPNDLALEFGSAFPDKPMVGASPGFTADVRIVLSPSSLAGLAQAFAQAAKQQSSPMNFPPTSGPVN